jgi:membrane protein involved in colicin uptake
METFNMAETDQDKLNAMHDELERVKSSLNAAFLVAGQIAVQMYSDTCKRVDCENNLRSELESLIRRHDHLVGELELSRAKEKEREGLLDLNYKRQEELEGLLDLNYKRQEELERENAELRISMQNEINLANSEACELRIELDGVKDANLMRDPHVRLS